MQTSFSENQLIRLQDNNWLVKQKIAGQCVTKCLDSIRKVIEGRTPNITLKDLDQLALSIMTEMDCIPTFKDYQGGGSIKFPGNICASVNKQLVHGIPTDYVLQNGDVVKIDLGATYQGAIGDAAITVIYGDPKSPVHLELIDTCKKALENSIKAIAVGKRLGVIGSAIHHTVKNTRFKLITNYGGHGIAKDTPHAQPFVCNKSVPTTGIRMQPGLTIAIEPMLVLGDTKTRVAEDGWTVLTDDIGVHMERTIYLGADKTHLITEQKL